MGLTPRASLLEPSLERLTSYILLSEYSGTHGPQQPGLWVFMELKCTKMSTHRHTNRYTYTVTHSENISLLPKRNGSYFLRHSLQIEKPPLKKLMHKSWPGICPGANLEAHWKCLTYPEKWSRRVSQDSYPLVPVTGMIAWHHG